LTSVFLQKDVGSALETENSHEHKERRTFMRKAQIHRAARLLTVLVIVVVGTGAVSPRALAATLSVRVPAGTEWVNSGILVEAGQTVCLTAKGVAITGPLKWFPGAISGPEGQVWNLGCGEYEGAPPPCALDGAPYGALVGRVGPSGEPFLIGGASSFSPPASGWLYLTVNDNLGLYLDNLAGFTVLFPGK
jgi:hypothetical protein